MDNMQQVESHLVMRHMKVSSRKGVSKDVDIAYRPKFSGQEDRTMNLFFRSTRAGKDARTSAQRDIVFQRSSTGDILRAAAKGTLLGREAKSYMDRALGRMR
jgi:hypothetical protein